MKKRTSNSGVPVRLIFSGTIIISMLVLAAALTLCSYLYARISLTQQVEQTAHQTTLSLEKQIGHVTSTAQQSVQLLALNDITSMTSTEERLQRIPMLANMMTMNHILSAVYVGYEDGDFFLLRSLENERARERLSAPLTAQYLLQAIDRDPEGRILSKVWGFYDAQFNPIQKDISSDDYAYDPRSRPWYQSAQQSDTLILTSPYVFFTTEEIGATFALRDQKHGAVVGVDASINDLSGFMHALAPSKSVEMALIDQNHWILGHSNPEISLIEHDPRLDAPALRTTLQLANSAFAKLLEQPQRSQHLIAYKANNEDWYGISLPVFQSESQQWQFLYTIPKTALLRNVHANLLNQLLLSLAVISILMIFGWLVGRSISKPLHQLSQEVSALAAFDFSRKIRVSSPVKEINILSSLTDRMALTIHNFQSITDKLAHDPNLERMLEQVSDHLQAITASKAGAVYLFNTESQVMELATQTNLNCPSLIACQSNQWADLEITLNTSLSAEHEHLFLTPLIDRDSKILGVLVLQLPENALANKKSFRRFMDEVSGAAAAAISTRRQFESQQALLDGIIRLLADAIDAKSPYTSGHCERVPELAKLLADAAERSQDGELAQFSMTEYQRREFHIAAWLHDCGKITSPVHVVDKATKLETIYNRIHEVRTRFEVLWRDAEIDYLSGCLNGQSEAALRQKKHARQEQLQEDFAFVAQTNIGGEFMKASDIERLNRIAEQEWMRHFSNRIGLSQEEEQHLPHYPENLPRREPLLANKPEHIENWGERRPPVEFDHPENIWGFDMQLPAQAYNKGELYNLSVKRGTLTEEERFVIQDHMVQTIKMLSSLPFPEELKNVPNIAGNHHEQLDGTGYPRGLKREQLSIQDRILAIADVFEALTAADRPYKVAKTLSESLQILAFMVKDEHLDGALFKLFVDSKAYLDYAKRHLKPEQIDPINPQWLFEIAGLTDTEPMIS